MEDRDQIDLARVAPFQLGRLHIVPALRQVASPGLASETLEPRVMQVFVALASANGNVVPRDDLIRRCWEGRIVGEDSISRTIARLRKLADDHGDAGFRIETITKVGYRLTGAAVVAEALPVPGTLTAAPARAPAGTSRTVWPLLLFALVVAAVLALVWRAMPSDPGHLGSVLRIGAFNALSETVPQNLPTTLQTEFQLQNSSLTNPWITITRSPPADPAQAYVVTGTLRQTGTILHVIVNLVHEASGEILLSQTFDQPADASEAAIHDFVAKATTNVQCALTYSVQGRTSALPLTTQRLLAQWCQANNAPEPNPAFEVATIRAMIRTSPDFALGHAMLAGALAGGMSDQDKTIGRSAYDEASAALATAERLGPPSYLLEMSRARLLPSRDHAAREVILRASAERFSTETGGFAAYTYGNFLFNVGRIGEATSQQLLALKLNPGRPAWRVRLVDLRLAAGQVDEADALLAKLMAEAQDPDTALDTRIAEALRRGRYDAAETLIAASVRVHPALKAGMAQAIAAMKSGNAATRDAAARQLVLVSQSPGMRTRFLVSALVALGHDAEALQLAEGLTAGAQVPATQLLFQPALARARALPAFAALAGRLGLADFWRKSRHQPDFCVVAAAPPICAQL